MEAHGSISPPVYAVYCDWIRGDVLKRGKSERYLREVLGAIVKRLGSRITWNSLASDLSIDHPATVADYVELLARMDVLTILPAMVEDRLAGAPKKARKVVIPDPFVLHAVRSWLEPHADPFSDQAIPLIADPEWAARLAELCADTHHARLHPTYYIKAEGEVDIAYVADGRFWPIEVKWSSRVRPGDLKQAKRYPNAAIVSRDTAPSIHGIRNELLPHHLLRLGPSPYVASER
jgi:predicted AAA+ superfamily ATPase